MRLYFQRAELILHQKDGKYVLEMGGKELSTFSSEKRAVSEFNRIRRDLEQKLPPTEISDEERRATLERYLADTLVAHNSLRAAPAKKPPKSRTFG